jgi:hypothetical protein
MVSLFPKPPIPPDLVPANYYLFPKMKSILKKCRFQSEEEVKQSTMMALKVSGNGAQECVQQCYAAGTNVQWQKKALKMLCSKTHHNDK